MRMKSILLLILCAVGFGSYGQKTSVEPDISPALFQPSTTITVTYDVTGTTLANLTAAYAWVWIPNKNIDAKYNVNPANSNVTATNNAKFVKSVENGKTLFTLTFKPSDFFNQSISSETQLGILLKGNDWTNGQTVDHIAGFWDGSFTIQLTSPSAQPLFVDNGDDITIEAETPVNANYDLYINNVLVDEQDNTTTYSHVHTVTEITGGATVKLVATQGINSSETTFQYLISSVSPAMARPAGIIPGINYNAADQTKVTLCLLAPGKNAVYAFGDFSDWQVLPANLMKKDGEYFWIELSGLTAGQEYGFQYLVDETLFVADPYADKILDPDDQYIPTATYPSLKAFPAAALKSEWYFNRVAVFQTGQTPYDWQLDNFEKPAQEKLVVYERLLRDFLANGYRNYQSLIDSIQYFKRLGVNAIELMPIMEFNGNEGWGYNPTFMMAPDKYYGTKNKMKEFVDVCHANGIAVILDIALNHQDLPNPYALMDFDFASGKPSATNKWFNTDAKHPFNVFYDMNHESSYTKAYVDTIAYYWLNEFKVDGYRFDLSKGFTQVNNPNNVNAWSAYDASRVALLKRMANKIWSHTPDAYVILEHLAVNQEEKELAEAGMMLWGNMNHAYNQNTMGFASESNISGVYYGSRSWNVPHLVGYMESHDEERLMYKNEQFGGALGGYSVKDEKTGLSRIRAANILFYTVPGPKMLWQFGEIGFDYSINRCEDGTISDGCRLSPKPVPTDYTEERDRQLLFAHTADVIKLRSTYPVFTEGTATFSGMATLTKQITLKGVPYKEAPTNTDEMNVQIVTNLDLSTKNISIEFPHTGIWYDYYRGGMAINVTTTPFSISFDAGAYALYTDVEIDPSIVTANEEKLDLSVQLYPNPVQNILVVKSDNNLIRDVKVVSMTGVEKKTSRVSSETWDFQHISRGLYVLEIVTQKGIVRKKIVKE